MSQGISWLIARPPPKSHANSAVASPNGRRPALRSADTWVVRPSAVIAIASSRVSMSSAMLTSECGSRPRELMPATVTKPRANQGGRCTADQVAQHLSMDRCTLHRHLKAGVESFSSMMQAVRSEFALRQIRDGDRPLAELAELLGFSSPSAFAFWFRRRFGCTVSAWRENQPLPGSG